MGGVGVVTPRIHWKCSRHWWIQAGSVFMNRTDAFHILRRYLIVNLRLHSRIEVFTFIDWNIVPEEAAEVDILVICAV